MDKKQAAKIRLCDIPLSWLNSRCLDLIAHYATRAYEYDCTEFKPMSRDILSEVSSHARSTQSQSLTWIYSKLKHEIKEALEHPEMTSKVMSLSKNSLGFPERQAA